MKEKERKREREKEKERKRDRETKGADTNRLQTQRLHFFSANNWLRDLIFTFLESHVKGITCKESDFLKSLSLHFIDFAIRFP